MSQGFAQELGERLSGRSTRVFLVFLVVYVAAMIALRGQFDVRYNDTANLNMYLTEISHKCLTTQFWQTIWLRRGGEDGVTGVDRPDSYRPLQFVYGLTASWLYFHLGPLPDYAMCFLLLGLSGYLVFRLYQVVGTVYLAGICAAAYLFFPPVVSPAWNPLAGPQSIIPGAFAAGLLAYLHYCRTQRRKYLAVVALICAVGPLYKETIGVLPFLLLTHYLFLVPGKSWRLLTGLAIGCFHGLFPSAVLTFALTGEIHVISIFHCGALHDHAVPQTWRPNYLIDLAAFVPPSLLLASLVCIAVRTCFQAPSLRLALPWRMTACGINLARLAAPVMAMAAFCALIALMMNRPILPAHYANLLAFVTIGLHGLLYVDALIAGWFFCMFLPLLRIYFNTTQCGYVAAPLIYLIVAPLAHCCQALAGQNKFALVRVGLRYGLLTVGIAAFCDNALSVPNSWIAYRKIGRFNEDLFPPDLLAALLQPNANLQWRLLDNTVVIDDAVIVKTRFRFGRALYNFDYGVPPAYVIKNTDQLNGILARFNCFLVFADYVNPYRSNFWDPKNIQGYFRRESESTLRFEAFYMDPLRFYVDNRYRSMMGPPDFQDEFAKDTKWFRERFSNHFHVCVRQQGNHR